MKLNYLVIPIITIIAAVLGGYFTALGMDGWYDALNRPGWTPGGSVIGAVWTIIYILTTVSALIAWNKFKRDKKFQWIVGLFIVNAVLNAFWSLVFFTWHQIGLAIVEMILLEATVIALIVLCRPRSRWASALLWPYAAWVLFATYLAYSVWILN